ncbi:MAG TPA: manganese efflux pump [Streptosporangiaceae bacterium]|nr:manganese efflux pump [Streptosporangiaceae bacterium]
MLALLLLAAALGLSNFAGAVGIGVSGVSGRIRVRIAVVFGVFEAGMPVLGLALGQGVAGGLGRAAHWLGGGLLAAVGLVGLVLARRGARRDTAAASGADQAPAGPRPWGIWRMLVSGLALSVDNLAAGFALGAYPVGLAVAATVFGVVSVIMSLAGLELGAKIGAAAGGWSELIACAMLVAVGGVMAAGAF